MAIPKKRKKLDVSEQPLEAKPKTKTSKKKAVKKSTTTKKSTTSAKSHSETDVDKAFEVMEKLAGQETVETQPRQLQLVRKVYSKEEAGIHISFTIDVFQLQDILKQTEQAGEPVQDYLEFDVTIPYPWNLPFVNDITKVVVTKLKEMNLIK